MDTPLHLVAVHVAWAAQDDRRCRTYFGALRDDFVFILTRTVHNLKDHLDEDEFVVADPGLSHSLRLSKKSCLEALLSLDVGEACDKGGA